MLKHFPCAACHEPTCLLHPAQRTDCPNPQLTSLQFLDLAYQSTILYDPPNAIQTVRPTGARSFAVDCFGSVSSAWAPWAVAEMEKEVGKLQQEEEEAGYGNEEGEGEGDTDEEEENEVEGSGVRKSDGEEGAEYTGAAGYSLELWRLLHESDREEGKMEGRERASRRRVGGGAGAGAGAGEGGGSGTGTSEGMQEGGAGAGSVAASAIGDGPGDGGRSSTSGGGLWGVAALAGAAARGVLGLLQPRRSRAGPPAVGTASSPAPSGQPKALTKVAAGLGRKARRERRRALVAKARGLRSGPCALAAELAALPQLRVCVADMQRDSLAVAELLRRLGVDVRLLG